MNATHTFTRPGKYNISLTVANANGSNTTINPGFINVKSSEAPVADFSVNVTSGNAPLKVLFTDNSTESPTSWFWDFGNGINSKHAINATHTFTKPGVYDITLTVTNTAGSDTMKKTEYITVQST
jgi:PKD repeat protein